MTDNKIVAKADDIFRRWQASFLSKDAHLKTIKNLPDDLDLLIGHLCKLGMSDEEVRPYIEDFIKVYTPTVSVMEHTYKRLKASGRTSKSREDFIFNWKNGIESLSWDTFYNWFPIDTSSDQEVQTLIKDKNKRAKSFSSTSEEEETPDIINREKRELAAYAELFPVITSEMIKDMQNKK